MDEGIIEAIKTGKEHFRPFKDVLFETIEEKDENGQNYAHIAAKYFCIKILQDISLKKPNLLTEKDKYGLTPLYYAATAKSENENHEKQLECVKFLLMRNNEIKNDISNSIKSIELLEDFEEKQIMGKISLKERYSNEGPTYIITVVRTVYIDRYFIYRPCKLLEKIINFYNSKLSDFIATFNYNLDDCGYIIEYFNEDFVPETISPYLLIQEISQVISLYKESKEEEEEEGDIISINASNIYTKNIKIPDKASKEKGKTKDTVLFKVGDCFLGSIDKINADASSTNFFECAPELLIAENFEERKKLNNKRAKLWSLGCILYNFLSHELFLKEKRSVFKTCGDLAEFYKSESCEKVISDMINGLKCDKSYKTFLTKLLSINRDERDIYKDDVTSIKGRNYRSSDFTSIKNGLEERPLSFRDKYEALEKYAEPKEGGFGKVTTYKNTTGCLYSLKIAKYHDKNLYFEAIKTGAAGNEGLHDHSFYNEPNPWFLYTYIDGCTLKDFVNNDDTIEKIDKYIIMYGVAYSFSIICKKMLHRDLTENNILIDRFNEPHIIDFGEGKNLSENLTAHSKNHRARGTLCVIPPEGRGNNRSYNDKYDVYGYGITMSNAFNSDNEMGEDFKERIFNNCLKEEKEERISFEEILKVLDDIIINDEDLTGDDLIKFFVYKEKIGSLTQST